jgi:hypothetical protein
MISVMEEMGEIVGCEVGTGRDAGDPGLEEIKLVLERVEVAAGVIGLPQA